MDSKEAGGLLYTAGSRGHPCLSGRDVAFLKKVLPDSEFSDRNRGSRGVPGAAGLRNRRRREPSEKKKSGRKISFHEKVDKLEKSRLHRMGTGFVKRSAGR